MQRTLAILIPCIVAVISLVIPFLFSIQYASPIVTEEELAERAVDKASAEQKAMNELTWKNYTNSEFGFSIEYPEVFDPPQLLPADWAEGDMTVPNGAYSFLFNNYKTVENSFLPSFSADLNVYLADSFDKTLRQFMYEDHLVTPLNKPVQPPTEISIAGNTTGLEFITKGLFGEPGKSVGFVHDKYLYTFDSQDLDTKNRNILYDHMLNSIKFVTTDNNDDKNDQVNSDNNRLDDNEQINESDKDEDENDNNNDDASN